MPSLKTKFTLEVSKGFKSIAAPVVYLSLIIEYGKDKPARMLLCRRSELPELFQKTVNLQEAKAQAAIDAITKHEKLGLKLSF